MIPDLDERLAAIDAMPHGPARTEAAQLLVDESAISGSLEAEFRARAELASSANFSGARDIALASIGWLLRMQDQQPSLGDPHRLVWMYKWVIGSLLLLPTVSRQTAAEALEDFARRTKQLGYGDNAIAKLRAEQSALSGDLASLVVLDRAWLDTPRDAMSDCLACDRSERADWLVDLDRDTDALESLQPLLDGRLRCLDEPHRGIAKALGPLRRAGRIDDAHALHRRGYRLIRSNPAFLPHLGLHLRHLACTGNLGRAARLSARHVQAAEASRIPMDRLEYATGLLCVLDAAAALGVEAMPLRVPDVAADVTDVAALRSAAARICEGIAELYDRRNGNSFYRDRLAAARREACEPVDAPLDALLGEAAGGTGGDAAPDTASPTQAPADAGSSAPGSEPGAPPDPSGTERGGAADDPPTSDADDDTWAAWARSRWRARRFEDALRAWQHILDGHLEDEPSVVLPLERQVLAARLRLGHEDARPELIALGERAEQLGLVPLQARVLFTLAHHAADQRELDEALRLLDEGLSMGPPEQPDEDRDFADAYGIAAVRFASLSARTGPIDDVRPRAELGLALLQHAAEPSDLVVASMDWALARAGSGELVDALQVMDGLIDAVEELDPPTAGELRPTIRWWRARMLTDLDRTEDAATAWDEASELLTPGHELAQALAEAGRAHLQRERPAVALPRLRRAAALFREQGSTEHAVAVDRIAARALVTAGQPDIAIDLLDEAVAETDSSSPSTEVAQALILAAELLADTGDTGPAAQRLDVAREHLVGCEHGYGVAVVDEFLGDLLDPDAAADHLARAADGFRAAEENVRAGRCLRKLGDVDNQRGEHESAAVHAALAVELLQGEEHQLERAVARRVLAQAHRQLEDFGRTEAEARTAAAEAAGADDPEQRYIAEAVLLESLEAEGRTADALLVARSALAALPPEADGAIEFLTERVSSLEQAQQD